MTPEPIPVERGSRRGWIAAAGLCLLHTVAIYVSAGGWRDLISGWPIPRDDHPFHFHTSRVTRTFLLSTGTTAGYDPSFMAGYPLSAVATPSTNPAELVLLAFGGRFPAQAYKIYAFAAASAVPWIVLAGVAVWRGGGGVAFVAVLLFLFYLWTDFPINYVRFGMLGHLLVVPLALLAVGLMMGFLEEGGLRRWTAGALAFAIVLLVHPLGLMVLLPSFLAGYFVVAFRKVEGRRRPGVGRHLGVGLWPVVALGANLWWWWPAIVLADTAEADPYAFIHPEPLIGRLAKILWSEAPAEAFLLAGLGGGLLVLWRADRARAVALLGFAASGWFWGYVAASQPIFKDLQPGRQTYALYTAAALATAFCTADLAGRLRRASRGTIAWATVGATLIVIRVFLPSMAHAVQTGVLGEKPILTSRPTPQLLWLVDRLRKSVPEGSRLLYEEGGGAHGDVIDPFDGDRYGGLLPYLTGVEVIGGPFLRVPLKHNFVQFGDGKLCGVARWGRADFEKVTAIYRPSAIVCWSPRARAFCRENTDLVEILDENELFLLGRVANGGGATISGTARVRAEPGRLVVEDARPGLDGRVVLSYHFDPHLRSDPPIPLEPVAQGSDPVPFIGFRPTAGRLSLVLDLSP